VAVKINSLAVAQDLSLSMNAEIKSGLTLTPATASPVLKTKIVIQID
jgi:hypothetical protein